MVKCLKDIKECRSTQVPLYDFKTNSRIPNEFTAIHPSDVVMKAQADPVKRLDIEKLKNPVLQGKLSKAKPDLSAQDAIIQRKSEISTLREGADLRHKTDELQNF